MVRQGVERGRGADAAAQQRFLAMLAAVRQIEAGSEGSGRPYPAGAAHDMGGDSHETRGDRDVHQVGSMYRVADADPSLARDPVLRVRDALTPSTASGAAVSVPGAMLESSATRYASQSARPRGAAGPVSGQISEDAGRALSAASPRDVAQGRSDASAHRAAAPVQPVAHGATPFPAVTSTSASQVVGHAVQPVNVPSSPPSMVAPGGPSRAATGSWMAASRSGSPDAGARDGGIAVARAEVAIAAVRSASDTQAHLDAPADATPIQAEAPSMALQVDPRQVRHGRATDRFAEGASGRAADPAESELGAMLRHLMGAGGTHRAQRLADGSWVMRIAIPGEGAVSIRIAQSPEQISVRLSGDPELVRRVRETLEVGGTRDGRRLSIQDTAEA
jgi:hypothetical protein